MRRPLTALVLLGSTWACANLPPRAGSDEDGQHFSETFVRTLRWEGPRASATLVAPELQREYLDRIKADKLEDKLKISEIETRELARTGPQSLAVNAEISWFVEPEVTLHHELMTLELRYRAGGWVIEGIEGGPVSLARLGEPPSADGGEPAVDAGPRSGP